MLLTIKYISLKW